MSLHRAKRFSWVVVILALVAPAASESLPGQLYDSNDAGGSALEAVLLHLRGELHPQHTRSFALTKDLMAIHEDSHGDVFAEAIALAKRSTLGQATMTGYEPTAPVALKGYALPSDALRELASRHDVKPSLEQLDSMKGLDRLAEPLRGALARFVDAFLALDVAARVDADLTHIVDIDSLRFDDEGVPGYVRSAAERADVVRRGGLDAVLAANSGGTMAEDFRGIGVDLSLMFPTRVQFLDAIEALRASLQLVRPPDGGACNPVSVWPAFSIDLTTCDDKYRSSYALQFDAGGNDWYNNNAGGSNIWGGYFCGLVPTGARAAAVDLGEGDDLYGNPGWPAFCGVNGGGFLAGMGFLLDDGGSDEYVAGCGGSNGGAFFAASGFLLDVGGQDRYDVRCLGNGAGVIAWGMQIDTGGDDSYVGGPFGATNGEGGGNLLSLAVAVLRHGAGFLLDTEGDDVYDGGELFANGGGADGGQGFLVDLEGTDTYIGGAAGVNGGGYTGATGFLLDAAGGDAYQATYYGTNGGGVVAGVGMLVDLTGDDAYTAKALGTNGGGSGTGVGTLLDGSGNDRYVATYGGANGAGGVLDTTLGAIPVGSGLLVDAGGSDHYSDDLVTCDDCSLAPKGVLGAQLDSDSAPEPPSIPDATCVRFVLCVGHSPPTLIEAGGYDTCALFPTRDVTCWGSTLLGQPGGYDGGRAIGLSAGVGHGCALLSDGNVLCWGENGLMLEYRGGDAIAVSDGWDLTCALRSNGNARCWGMSNYGGDYETGDAVKISTGSQHTCALVLSGSVRCWGADAYGVLAGYGGHDATAVASGHDHSCALLRGGNVTCWGFNASGQARPYVLGDAVAVGAGGRHTCALLNSGNVHCWGEETHGESADYFGGDAVAISLGDQHSCALVVSGNVHCWGSNTFGQSAGYRAIGPLEVG